MYELRSDEKKMPIRVDRYEKALAYKETVKEKYNREIFIKGDDGSDEFDINIYLEEKHRLKTPDADIIILGMDLAQLEQKEDFSILLTPIFSENEALVNQFKSGNDKALNALMGKFLKNNKGYDPKEVKDVIIKLLTQ